VLPPTPLAVLSGGSVEGAKARQALLAEEFAADFALQRDGDAARCAPMIAHVSATAFVRRHALPPVLLTEGLAVGPHAERLARRGVRVWVEQADRIG